MLKFIAKASIALFGCLFLFVLWAAIAAMVILYAFTALIGGWYAGQFIEPYYGEEGRIVFSAFTTMVILLCGFAFYRQNVVWLSGGDDAGSSRDRPKPITGGHQPSDPPTNNKRDSDGRPIPPTGGSGVQPPPPFRPKR